jgi:hypothetical protein
VLRRTRFNRAPRLRYVSHVWRLAWPRVWRLVWLHLVPILIEVGGISTMSTTAFALPSGTAGAGEGNDTPRIHLRGSGRIDAHVGRSAQKPFVAGVVSDDAGRPIARIPVLLRISREAAPNTDPHADIPLSAASPAACRDGAPRPVLDSAERIIVETDDAGRFCVRLALARDHYWAHFETRAESGPASLVDSTQTVLPFDLTRDSIELRFEQAPSVVSLDGIPVPIDVTAASTNEDAPVSTAGLVLRLSNETGAVLGEATTNQAGRARFTVPAVRFGSPGNGELRAVFAGSPAIEASSHSRAIERDTRVQVVVANAMPDPVRAIPTLPSASPEEGVSVDVVARADCADVGCQALPTGSVEMRIGDVLVAAAPLRKGAAHLAPSFETAGAGDVIFHLRYRPDVLFFRAADDTEARQPTRSPEPWGKVATALAGLGVIAWFVIPRLPSRRRETLPRPRPMEAGIEHRPVPNLQDGWTGRVLDAYEGSPVAGADIRIERPGFEGSDIVIETQSIVDGTFSLTATSARHGDQLVVSTSLHTPLQRRLPTFGHLDVTLVRRRYTLLEQFVGWAKRTGGRFDARPEPTPAHVREAAGASSPVGAWADALEKAVYGGAPVDASVQREIDRMNPERQERTPPKPVARGRNSPA